MIIWSQQKLFAFFALICCVIVNSLPGEAPRVIILFTADNIGPGDLKQDRIFLPNLKFLEEQSTNFENFHSSSPLKTSAFYSIYSGLDSGQHSFRNSDNNNLILKSPDSLMAKTLADLNYETVFAGSWPFGENKNLLPKNFGFNFFYGYYNNPRQHPRFPSILQFNESKIELNNNFISRHQKISLSLNVDDVANYQEFQGANHAPETVHRTLIKFISTKLESGEKIFLHYAHNGLRPGLQANPEDLKSYKGRIPDIPYAGQNGYTPSFCPRAAQLALFSELDRQLGDIITTLQKLKIFEKSLIIFSSPNAVSNNGGRDITFFKSNDELKGSRGTFYQGGLRTPCLAHWPELLKKNSKNQDLMSQTTLYQSIISVAKNETKPIFLPNTELYWESEAFRALRKGKYKLIQKKSLLTPSYILLYDLESDPIEEVNIFDENIDQVKALVELANSKHQVFEEKPSPFDPKVEDSNQN